LGGRVGPSGTHPVVDASELSPWTVVELDEAPLVVGSDPVVVGTAVVPELAISPEDELPPGVDPTAGPHATSRVSATENLEPMPRDYQASLFEPGRNATTTTT
jgi:hypothetical protein